MSNGLPIPYLHRIELVEGNTIFVNPNNIDKIEYHSVNSNWCEIFLANTTEPLIVRNSPEEFFDSIINGYNQFKNKLS
jgi:uncharacterized protein YlzI (FlbEa/FlbD family)